MTDLKVVELPGGDLLDIPKRMETVAGQIAAGDHGVVTAGVCVLVDDAGNLKVFGWGRTDDVHTVGLLHLGAAWLAQHRVERA